MPDNCPLNLDGECEECRFLTDDYCWWFFPARPLKEILTEEERITKLELPPNHAIYKLDKKSQDDLNQLKGRLSRMENAVMKARAKKKDETYE